MFRIMLFVLVLGLWSCVNSPKDTESQGLDKQQVNVPQEHPYIIVLGTVQDAGSPHASCKKKCCSRLFDAPDPTRMVTCLGIVDPVKEKTILLEASPDLPRQMELLHKASEQAKEVVDAIFLTHAHIGHYTGLMYLGRESMNAQKVPVYAMPRMARFLSSNGPWDQLIEIGNIEVSKLVSDSTIHVTDNVSITPISVPHRDEYSETVGYHIQSKKKNVLFIPDIDKWDKWSESITDWISKVDVAFLDGTFYDDREVNRDMSEIPHPFVVESMHAFESMSKEDKAKIHFIHFNHTNPLLDINSPQAKTVLDKGYNIASFHQVFNL